MSTYYWSDLHLGQPDVAEERGFATPDEHDDHLIAAWAATVKPADTIWILGDLALSEPSRALEIIRYLPGIKKLIWGNHDLGHPMHRDARRNQARYLDVFDSAATTAAHRIGGHEVKLSHFPYRDDARTQDRYRQFRLQDDGSWLIHGHVHDEFTVEGRQVNVGVDKWIEGPVEESVLLAILEEVPVGAAA